MSGERASSQLVMMFKGVLSCLATVHQTNHVSREADAQSLRAMDELDGGGN